MIRMIRNQADQDEQGPIRSEGSAIKIIRTITTHKMTRMIKYEDQIIKMIKMISDQDEQDDPPSR